jgi:hypothetical protein
MGAFAAKELSKPQPRIHRLPAIGYFAVWGDRLLPAEYHALFGSGLLAVLVRKIMISTSFAAWHSLVWKQVKNITIADQMHSFGMQSNKVSTELAIFMPYAGFDAEKVRIRAIGAFTQRNTYLRYRDMAGTADGEEIFALSIIFAARQFCTFFNEAEYSATHENMGMGAMIRLDLFKTLVCPVDAILTVNHKNFDIEKA